jgi:CopG family transcriptional regulator/antitoxin EndoAI
LPQLKKILITVPDSLLQEVDILVSNENTSRSELIREAMRLYIKERKKAEVKEKMKKGYQEMAQINLQFAEMCFEADEHQFKSYEEKLAECE